MPAFLEKSWFAFFGVAARKTTVGGLVWDGILLVHYSCLGSNYPLGRCLGWGWRSKYTF